VSRTPGIVESLPDGGARGSIDCVCRRILGASSQASWLGSRYRDGMAEPPLTRVTRTRSGLAGASARDRTRSGAGASSRREEAHESTDPATSPWPGHGVVARTGSRGEQGFEAGVPASNRRARPGTAGGPRGCAQAHQTGWPSDRGEPSSRLLRRACLRKRVRPAKSWRVGESDREKLVQSRAGGGRTRTRKEATARESGYGSPGRESSEGRSRDASGMEQGREASGCHGTRRDFLQEVAHAPRTCQIRREGQEP